MEPFLGRLVIRRYAQCTLFVIGIMTVNVFAGLRSSAVDSSDEARYGVSAYEMLRDRSFLVTTYAGETDYWSRHGEGPDIKPPLGYWLLGLSFTALGPSVLALRLPSALFALATVALTMIAARRWFNRRVAILSGLIMATAFPFLSHHGARSGDFDAALTCLLLLAAIQISRLRDSPNRVVLLALILACGALLKSFAIMPMILVGCMYVVATGEWRKLRAVDWALAALVFALPVAAWIVARAAAEGSTRFLVMMVQGDLIARATKVVDHGDHTWYGPLGGVTDRFAPWSFIMLGSALVSMHRHRWHADAFRRWLWRGTNMLLLLWVAIPLLLVSVMRTQHHWYLDPIYPACAMLASLGVLSLLRWSRGSRFRPAAFVLLVVLPLVFCEARVMARIYGKDRTPASQRFLRSLKQYRAQLGPDVYVLFALSPSERFILEVEDEFNVAEVSDPGMAPAAAPPSRWLLVSTVPRTWSVDPPAAAALLGDETYAVYPAAR